MDITHGRSEFEIHPLDRDYSGLSISDRYLSGVNIERSFFNGVNLTNCAFDRVKLNNTEFSEAKIEKGSFTNCELAGSDFVGSLIEYSSFSDCSFEKGEWRETTFKQCKFIACNFDHTTVTLCKFLECELDAQTLATAEHRAVYFNVFSRNKFGRAASDAHFSSRNFGIPASEEHGTLVPPGSEMTIEQMCLLNNVGRLRVVDVAEVAESICTSLAGRVQRRTSTLVFFSKIVRVLTDERRISATSLIYLEQLVLRFAGATDDQDLFTAAMTTVIEIRSALFSVATEGSSKTDGTQEDAARQIIVHFNESYTRGQADALRDTLASVTGEGSDVVVIDAFRNGSTFIDMALTSFVSIGTLLVALNFVLRQAKISIDRWRDLNDSIKYQGKRKRTVKTKKASRTRRKVPAIMKTGPVLPELAPVRAAVNRHGRELVEMDEPADIRIAVFVSIKEMQGR